MLLSGGEGAHGDRADVRDLQSTPSPFCLLDEIDAPLDGANIGRFVELLRGMIDRTQFIIITQPQDDGNREPSLRRHDGKAGRLEAHLAADELARRPVAPRGPPAEQIRAQARSLLCGGHDHDRTGMARMDGAALVAAATLSGLRDRRTGMACRSRAGRGGPPTRTAAIPSNRRPHRNSERQRRGPRGSVDRQHVDVTAERTASAGSDEAARELLGRLEMREESRRRASASSPRSKSWRGGYGAKFLVRVPAGVHVDLRTVNGGVRLDNVGGEVRATSTNGGVKGTIAGASLVEARTTNGGVELSIAGAIAPDADVRLTSVNGGVRLDVPGDTRASVSARCTNGRVDVSALPLAVEGEQTRRRVQGTLNGGGARIDLQTTNGGVTIGRS
jgi:hypothetical protein